MSQLNSQQQAAIDFCLKGKGHLNLIARAGTGKTTTLIEIAKAVPGKVFMGAFNRAIADELKQRIAGRSNVTANTLHGAGLGAWRRCFSRNVEVMVDGDKIRNMVRDSKIGWAKDNKVATAAQMLISYAKQAGLGVSAPYEDVDKWEDIIDHYDVDDDLPATMRRKTFLENCIDTYEKSLAWCTGKGTPDGKPLLDFDDMLLAPLYHQAQLPQYNWVLIDEAQDTSECRRRLSIGMARQFGRVIAVGDDKQAIYGFAGATNDAMEVIKHELKSAELPLNVTYRCPASVVKLAQQWVPDFAAHESAPEGEVRRIHHSQFWHEKFNPYQDVILCRYTRPLAGIAATLRDRGIPCIVEGQSAKALVALANKWGDIPISAFSPLLDDYEEKKCKEWTMVKDRPDKAAAVHDRCGTIKEFARRMNPDATTADLVQQLQMVFSEQQSKSGVLRLCTVHRCVHPDTIVETRLGMMRFRDIPYADCIATPFGNRLYTGKFTKTIGPTVKVLTKRGFGIEISLEHGMTVWSKQCGEHMRVEARDLSVGDWLRLKIGVTLDTNHIPSLPLPTPGHICEKLHKTPVNLTEDFAELLGLIVADGTIFQRGFRLVKRYRDVVNRFKQLCTQFFDCGFSKADTDHAGTPAVTINSTFLSRWLLQIGGLAPNKKYVPDVILRAPLRFQAAFLRGLFEDGTVNCKNGNIDHIHWENMNTDVAGVVQIMLLRFGIVATRKPRNIRGHDICTLYIYSQSARRFATQIGFVSRTKNEWLKSGRFGNDTHSLIPLSRIEVASLRRFFEETDYRNALMRGYISSNVAEKLTASSDSTDLNFLRERMCWVYQPIVKLTPFESETMCIEVSDGERFLQNGFDGWNSKGREWDRVYLVGRNEYMPSKWANQQWALDQEDNIIYVAITRSKWELVEVIVPETSPDQPRPERDWWDLSGDAPRHDDWLDTSDETREGREDGDRIYKD